MHGEGISSHENIGIWLVIIRSTIFITIEPCKCDQTSISPLTENLDLHYVHKNLFKSIFIGWSSPPWWCQCQEIIQPYCVMKKISNLTTFAQTLKDFTNVVESQGPFWQPLSWWPQFIPTWIMGFDWNWCIDTYTHCSLHLGTSVFCAIMRTKLDFILTCP